MVERVPVSQSGGVRHRVAVVDYLKAAGVILVILNHCGLFDTHKPFFLLVVNMPVPVFMILSGYVYTFAAGTGGLREQYRLGTVKRKFMRYTLPMMVAFLLRNVLDLMRGYQLSSLGICKSFVLGTYGAGAYYYHLMVEFIFLAPLLYGLIAKLKANGIMIVYQFPLGQNLDDCDPLCFSCGLYFA